MTDQNTVKGINSYFFDYICTQYFVLPGSIDPHLLVLLAYSLAMADCFPEELIKEIFTINFLGKLDSQLESKNYVIMIKSNVI